MIVLNMWPCVSNIGWVLSNGTTNKMLGALFSLTLILMGVRVD